MEEKKYINKSSKQKEKYPQESLKISKPILKDKEYKK